MLIELPSPQVLDIVGADAETFAQAQFCNDLRDLAVGRWQWNAWLSPQGRVRAWFHLLRIEDGRLRLILRGGFAPSVRDALSRYVLRAKAKIDVVSTRLIGAENERDIESIVATIPHAGNMVSHDSEFAFGFVESPARWLVVGASVNIDTDRSDSAVARWRAADMQSGIADLAPGLEDRFLPAWLGLDALDSISLRKGCYPGQEIVARLHFKGGNKRWLYRLAYSGSTSLLPGTELRTDAGNCGTLIGSVQRVDDHGVALAIFDSIADGTRCLSPESGIVFDVVARVGSV